MLRFEPFAVAAALASGACLPLDACGSVPARPASLERIGVVSGGDWLTASALYEDERLGRVTDIVQRAAEARYREILPGACSAVAAPEPEAFLLGCEGRVLRYAPRQD